MTYHSPRAFLPEPRTNRFILDDAINRYYIGDPGCILVLKSMSALYSTSPFELFVKYLMGIKVESDFVKIIKDISKDMPKDELNIPIYYDDDQLIILIMACLNNNNTNLSKVSLSLHYDHLRECCRVILSSSRDLIKTYYAKIFATLIINDPVTDKDYWPRLRDVISGNHTKAHKKTISALFDKLDETEHKLRILQSEYDKLYDKYHKLVNENKDKDRARDKEIRRESIEAKIKLEK